MRTKAQPYTSTLRKKGVRSMPGIKAPLVHLSPGELMKANGAR